MGCVLTLHAWSTEHRQGHKDNVHSVSFSPDGKQLVSGSADCWAKLWDAKSSKCTMTLRESTGFAHDDTLQSVSFSPDGRMILTGSLDRSAKLWDAITGDRLKTLEGHAGSLNSVA